MATGLEKNILCTYHVEFKARFAGSESLCPEVKLHTVFLRQLSTVVISIDYKKMVRPVCHMTC